MNNGYDEKERDQAKGANKPSIQPTEDSASPYDQTTGSSRQGVSG